MIRCIVGSGIVKRDSGDVAELPRSPGHAFYDRLQTLLKEAGFDVFVEELSASHYADGRDTVSAARPLFSPAAGRLFRRDQQRTRHCLALSDILSLRDFLRLANRDNVPDHSWLSRSAALPHEVHEKVFGWVLNLVAEHGLVKGERIGVDGSTMEANAALRTIVRRDSGKTIARC